MAFTPVVTSANTNPNNTNPDGSAANMSVVNLKPSSQATVLLTVAT